VVGGLPVMSSAAEPTGSAVQPSAGGGLRPAHGSPPSLVRNVMLTSDAKKLLVRARQGTPEALGQLLELYRNYLALLAATQIDGRLAVRCSPSDVVQETFLEAHRDFEQFEGQSEGEFLAWLRQILLHNLLRAVEQHIRAKRRCVRREISLQALGESLQRSTARLESVLVAPQDSPSGLAHRQESAVLLADQLAQLPPDYREVLVLRHLKALSFNEVAQRMDRSPGAVRMLWLRAIARLRELMPPRDES